MRQKTDDYTAGEFRTLVQVQRVRYTPDGAGGQTKQWYNHVQIWCFTRELRDNENYSDGSMGRVRSQASWEFVTWYRDDIKATDRLVLDGVYYNIRSPDNILRRNKWLRIVADSGVEQ